MKGGNLAPDHGSGSASNVSRPELASSAALPVRQASGLGREEVACSELILFPSLVEELRMARWCKFGLSDAKGAQECAGPTKHVNADNLITLSPHDGKLCWSSQILSLTRDLFRLQPNRSERGTRCPPVEFANVEYSQRQIRRGGHDTDMSTKEVLPQQTADLAGSSRSHRTR